MMIPTRKLRNEVKKRLELIVINLKEIDNIMNDVKHKNRVVYRSLKDKKEEYIVHTNGGGIMAEYRDSQGNKYEIKIHPRQG